MRAHALRLVMLTLMSIASRTARAQARPDLSGTWSVPTAAAPRPTVASTGDAAFRTGDMGSGWGTPLTIRQRGDSLVLEYPWFSTYDLQPPVRMAVALDGSESPNTLMIGHAEVMHRSRASWQGGALVITTSWPAPALGRDARVEVRQSLRLPATDTLMVETMRDAASGAAATVTRTTLVRMRQNVPPA
ncbi:MAG: hypothetical protein IT361_02755 [Gemmatimonadaceae bacterium]|nr:hypothetical protein [Gemmatimonadaceae bacterium]